MVENKSKSDKWLPSIIHALRRLGGKACLQEIYKKIAQLKLNLPKSYEGCIRSTIYHFSSDSVCFKKGDPDIFCNVSRGIWGLRNPDEMFFGKGESALFINAITMITTEEFNDSHENPGKRKKMLDEKIRQIRKTFKMGEQ